MRIACWITKATNIHSEYAIHIAFPLQQSRTRLSFKFIRTYVVCLLLELILRHWVFILTDWTKWIRETRHFNFAACFVCLRRRAVELLNWFSRNLMQGEFTIISSSFGCSRLIVTVDSPVYLCALPVVMENYYWSWKSKITNEELWRITHQKSIENQIKRRKWNWIGHTLRKETGALEKSALDWNPGGYKTER